MHSLKRMILSVLISALYVLNLWSQAATGLTLRELLNRSGSTDTSLLNDSCLASKAVSANTDPYFYIDCHINPSAEELFVFSRDGILKGELYGWELVTLPNRLIVYHDSEIHFAATHSLGISIFDPATGTDKKIYPPMPYSPTRQAFIARVAEVYKSRGEEWFKQHNHSGDPEMFDNSLQGDVAVDNAGKAVFFTVRYGDPDNVNDPLPFSELVAVRCAPFDSLTQLRCAETPKR